MAIYLENQLKSALVLVLAFLAIRAECSSGTRRSLPAIKGTVFDVTTFGAKGNAQAESSLVNPFIYIYIFSS